MQNETSKSYETIIKDVNDTFSKKLKIHSSVYIENYPQLKHFKPSFPALFFSTVISEIFPYVYSLFFSLWIKINC